VPGAVPRFIGISYPSEYRTECPLTISVHAAANADVLSGLRERVQVIEVEHAASRLRTGVRALDRRPSVVASRLDLRGTTMTTASHDVHGSAGTQRPTS
jgi:hypothetical protein